ncbi:MAG: hypothetical protein Kow0060_03390 [Methylohalobius crimeensis]
MDLRLKRRLVGAAVLVLLAVIFLPMMFEDALRDESDFSPPLTELPLAEEPSLPQVSTSQVPLPADWAVQVGSFSQADNADSLQNRLRQAGFAAFIEKVKAEEGVMYRVRVGPYLDKDKAEAMAAEIKQRLALDGFVVPHPD